ncbi:Synaptonemal complex protein 3 [Bulinus truncatus]|nr:Synaptonemal complex protein 3 [Bulinus truncatus]
MPKGKKSEYHSNNTTVNEIVEEFVVQSESSSPIRPVMAEIEEPLQVNKAGKKRIADSDYDPAEFSHEMQKMLEGFGADISKTLVQKKKRMEQLTQASLKNANKKVEEIWKNQQIARARLQEEFSKQVLLVYQQWESDIEKFKEQEEKLNTLLKQQQKFFQQSRIIQSQRLKTIKEMSEQFIKGLEDLERSRQSQQSSLQSELKKEMQLLQKKILMDTQQQEMANVRKSLHSILY